MTSQRTAEPAGSPDGEHSSADTCPVHSWNEWDPLEEVIVGTPLGAYIHTSLDNVFGITTPRHLTPDGKNLLASDMLVRAYNRTPYPPNIILPAHQQIENFVHVLEAEGVIVRRPDPYDLGCTVSTPFWSERGGYNFMNPRDLVLVVGDQLIEAPTAVRCRYFETFAFRRLFLEYHRRGARWVSAPKPFLEPPSYELRGVKSEPTDDPRYFMTSEYEPVFDAASFVRCGRDLFVIRDHATNMAGIRWVQQYLGSDFRVHVVGHKARNPMHIDVIFVPLAPGKALVNPEFIDELPDVLKKWDLLPAPKPNETKLDLIGFPSTTTTWISMNILSIDSERIFVEEQQVSLIAKLKDWGFKPIPLPFSIPPRLGGSFHCTTLDIRRRGIVENYF
jgi:glycine amidinotransferase